MYFQSSDIEREYHRIRARCDADDQYAGPLTLGLQDVLRSHFLIADHFVSEHKELGGVGPRSLDLLHSAVGRQHVGFAGKLKWTDRFDICATLMYGLIKDHPFYDANKRTALLSMLWHLRKVGRTPIATHKILESFMVDIAEGGLGKYARYTSIVRSGDPDAEVRFASDFLRRNTRELDRRTYIITYQQLNAILSRFDYGLERPQKNTIHLVKYFGRRKFLGIGPKVVGVENVATIGFPGWTREVAKGDIRNVRKLTKLDETHGYDSQAFFGDADPLPGLIALYHGPLERLANR